MLTLAVQLSSILDPLINSERDHVSYDGLGAHLSQMELEKDKSGAASMQNLWPGLLLGQGGPQ